MLHFASRVVFGSGTDKAKKLVIKVFFSSLTTALKSQNVLLYISSLHVIVTVPKIVFTLKET